MKKVTRLLAVVWLILSGCSQQARVVPQPVATHPRAELLLSREGLSQDVALEDIRFRSVGRFEETQFTVRNASTARYTLEYKVNWLDRDGFEARNGDGSWQRFTLSPGQREQFKSTGRSPEAYQVRVQLRLPDDVFIKGVPVNE